MFSILVITTVPIQKRPDRELVLLYHLDHQRSLSPELNEGSFEVDWHVHFSLFHRSFDQNCDPCSADTSAAVYHEKDGEKGTLQ